VVVYIFFIVGGNSLKGTPKVRLTWLFRPIDLHDKQRIINDVQTLQEGSVVLELILEIVGIEATEVYFVLNSNKI
jgi:hypothetical protein